MGNSSRDGAARRSVASIFARSNFVNVHGINHYFPPVTVYPTALKSSANSISIWAAASSVITSNRALSVDVFNRNVSSHDLDEALTLLESNGLASVARELTQGAPRANCGRVSQRRRI